MKLTAVVIAKNEEDYIEKCLMGLKLADELLVIDNNSSDQTVKKAQDFGARTYISEKKDFSALRNLGKGKAHGSWILYVDADEIVDKDLKEEIENAIKSDKFSAYETPRQNYYLGKRWPKEEYFVRLFKKEALLKWVGELHETPLFKGKVGRLKYPLIHNTHRDLSSMVSKTNEWSIIEAKLRSSNNHPPVKVWRLVRVMITTFMESYIKNEGWRAGVAGFIESTYQSFSIFITYAKLWELQQK